MIFWKWKKDEEYQKSYKNNLSKKLDANININENKREDIDSKLSNRSMISQINQNPFFQNLTFSEHLNIYDSNLKRTNAHGV